MTEWQEHQYDSGYYAGGRMPHYLFDNDSNPLGLVLMVSGAALIIFGFGPFLKFDDYDHLNLIGGIILGMMGVFGVLSFYAGLKKFGLNKRRKRK